MNAFRKAQDSFVRLDWQDTVLFPQQAVRQNLTHVKDAISPLEQGNAIGALDAIYEIDNNCYAFRVRPRKCLTILPTMYSVSQKSGYSGGRAVRPS
ncbi:MAG: hypothetical protein V8S98_03750 [Lachnospiraceae bacterium]